MSPRAVNTGGTSATLGNAPCQIGAVLRFRSPVRAFPVSEPDRMVHRTTSCATNLWLLSSHFPLDNDDMIRIYILYQPLVAGIE